MKILYIAAECKPFAKTGGVGDVTGELPLAIKKENPKIDIEIVIPLYGYIKFEKNVKRIHKYNIPFHGKNEIAEVFTADFQEIKINFIKNKTYFEGKYSKPYINSKNIAFYDDILRFSFFSRACLQLVKDKNPDIVHINDWVLGYLFGFMEIEKMPQKRILTVHNIGYQGNIGKETIIGWEIETIIKNKRIGNLFTDPRKKWNSVNALRLGLELSHMANTVSENYCREITKTEEPGRYFEGGKGLHQITKRLYEKEKLIGILNGYNYLFEPTQDKFKKILNEKAKMKKLLSRDFEDPDNFLLGFVGRAVEQKFKLLTEKVKGKSVLNHLLNSKDVNIAILATGLAEYERFIRKFIGRSNFSALIAFDKEKAQQISLGSDLFLIPSLFEPCGITQMESLSNATPPLVRWTGGLVDTVITHTATNGTGFGFGGNSKEEILTNLINTVKEALTLFKNDKDKFQDLQLKAFEERFLWSTSAKKYINELYEKVLLK